MIATEPPIRSPTVSSRLGRPPGRGLGAGSETRVTYDRDEFAYRERRDVDPSESTQSSFVCRVQALGDGFPGGGRGCQTRPARAHLLLRARPRHGAVSRLAGDHGLLCILPCASWRSRGVRSDVVLRQAAGYQASLGGLPALKIKTRLSGSRFCFGWPLFIDWPFRLRHSA